MQNNKGTDSNKPVARVKESSGISGFLKNLFVDNISGAFKKTINDTLKPRIQDILFNTVNDTAKNMIYGDKTPSNYNKSKYSNNTWGIPMTDYSNMSTSKSSTVAKIKDDSKVTDVDFDNKGIPEVILQMMKNHLSVYSIVSVGNYYDFTKKILREQYGQDYLNLSITAEDYNYGWRDLSTAYVSREIGGAYYIKFPKVICLK